MPWARSSASRAGHNPEYGQFGVIEVQLEEQRGLCSFATELQAPHKLALPDDWTPESGFGLSAEDLYARYGPLVLARLEDRLRAEPQFLSFDGTWLPASLAVDLHIGHVNIAEALVDIKSQALATEEILGELDLPAEAPESIKVFSLNRALSQDKRFHDVGDASGPAWSLRRWAPAGVASPRFACTINPSPTIAPGSTSSICRWSVR